MYLKTTHNIIGKAGLADSFLERIDSLDYDVFHTKDTEDRREMWAPHKEAEALLMRRVKPTRQGGNTFTHVTFDSWYDFKDLIDPLVQKVADYYNYEEAWCHQALLVNLPAHKKVYKHNDSRLIFQFMHRVHLPILTFPEVNFYSYYGDETTKVPMDTDVITEINNVALHEVENNSENGRIHLIFDVMVPPSRYGGIRLPPDREGATLPKIYFEYPEDK